MISRKPYFFIFAKKTVEMNFLKLNKVVNYKLNLVVSLIIIGLILIFVFNDKDVEVKKVDKYYNCNHILYASAPIEPSSLLNDKNEIHLLHARKNGLKIPFTSNGRFEQEIQKFIDNKVLVKVTDNGFYHVKKLSHSHPYLIPEGVEMLNEIAYRFRKRIKEKKLNNYAIVLTSLLRTDETQMRLSRRNGNATENSAHIYGTSVDISYKNFYNLDADSLESNWQGIQELTKTLIEMREKCKLLAVRERKQSCFHVTVVVCEGVHTKEAKKNEDK